jgi:hypothetical protein
VGTVLGFCRNHICPTRQGKENEEYTTMRRKRIITGHDSNWMSREANVRGFGIGFREAAIRHVPSTTPVARATHCTMLDENVRDVNVVRWHCHITVNCSIVVLLLGSGKKEKKG